MDGGIHRLRSPDPDLERDGFTLARIGPARIHGGITQNSSLHGLLSLPYFQVQLDPILPDNLHQPGLTKGSGQTAGISPGDLDFIGGFIP